MTRRPAPVLRLSNPMAALVWLLLFMPARIGGWRTGPAFAAAALALACAALAYQPSPWEARRPSRQAATVFLSLQLLYLLSYLYSAAFNGIVTGPWDHVGVARFFVMGVFAVYIVRHYDASTRKAMEWAAIAAPYFFLACHLLAPSRPLAGPFESPAALGYAAVLILCWLLFFSRSHLRYLHVAAVLVVLLCAEAPGAWAAAAVALAAALAAALAPRLKRAKRAAAWLGPATALAAAAALLPWAWSLAPQAQRRTLALVERSPVFGWGPAVYEFMPVPENQYLSWLLKNGAVGLGVIVLAAVAFAWKLASGQRDARRRAGATAFLAALSLLLVTGSFLDGYRLFLLSALLAAGVSEGGA